MKDQRHYDQHVVDIMLEHEEHIDGTGYPKGLRASQMHPFSMIAATANAFDRCLVYSNQEPISALRTMLEERNGLHPPKYLSSLAMIVAARPRL